MEALNAAENRNKAAFNTKQNDKDINVSLGSIFKVIVTFQNFIFKMIIINV